MWKCRDQVAVVDNENEGSRVAGHDATMGPGFGDGMRWGKSVGCSLQGGSKSKGNKDGEKRDGL